MKAYNTLYYYKVTLFSFFDSDVSVGNFTFQSSVGSVLMCRYYFLVCSSFFTFVFLGLN